MCKQVTLAFCFGFHLGQLIKPNFPSSVRLMQLGIFVNNDPVTHIRCLSTKQSPTVPDLLRKISVCSGLAWPGQQAGSTFIIIKRPQTTHQLFPSAPTELYCCPPLLIWAICRIYQPSHFMASLFQLRTWIYQNHLIPQYKCASSHKQRLQTTVNYKDI